MTPKTLRELAIEIVQQKAYDPTWGWTETPERKRINDIVAEIVADIRAIPLDDK